jgi:hypothetical protein
VCIAWIFFRAASVADGWYVLTHLLSGVGEYVFAVLENLRHLAQHRELTEPILLGKTLPRFVLLMVSVAVFFTASLLRGRVRIQHRSALIRWPAYYFLIAVIALLSVHDGTGFVYFQF